MARPGPMKVKYPIPQSAAVVAKPMAIVIVHASREVTDCIVVD
jgi:hypothetical protein